VNLPNSLTVGRIFLVPLLLVVLLTKPDGWRLFDISKEALGAVIFGLASLTDWLDGYVARRRKQVTGLGQWMDPLADKLLVTAALLSLLKMNLAPAWMVAVILGREFFVTVLRSIVHARGQALPASPIGKVKLGAQVIAILVLILGRGPLQQILVLGQAALWVATLAAIVSAMDYWRQFNRLPPVRPAGVAGSDAPRGRVSA
jgi:CDP-diacylglycerol--glycerol-3-phosphate 3-phosphatidyltransferase